MCRTLSQARASLSDQIDDAWGTKGLLASSSIEIELFDPREHRASGSGWSNGWSSLRRTWEASDVVLGEELGTATYRADGSESLPHG
jgi:hypothetical protein